MNGSAVHRKDQSHRFQMLYFLMHFGKFHIILETTKITVKWLVLFQDVLSIFFGP
jgi:hypothetical protein